MDISLLGLGLGPLAHVALLGGSKGSVVDVVVVVGEVGLMGGILLVEADDAVGIAVVVGLEDGDTWPSSVLGIPTA